MKILYLNPLGQLGGAEVCLLNLMASLRTMKPDCQLNLIVPENGSLANQACDLGVNVKVLEFSRTLTELGDAGVGGPSGKQLSRLYLLKRILTALPSVRRYLKLLRREIFEINPDIIHTNGFKMHILGALAKPKQTSLIWHIHDYVGGRPVMARLMRHYSSRCAVAVANSNSVAEDVRKVCGEALRVCTVYNGVDLKSFSPSGKRLDLDALSGLAPAPQGTVRVGLVATLARWKGHPTFLEAIALLPKSLPVRAYVIGGAIYRTAGSQHSLTELKEIAAKLKVSDRVGFTGFVDSPAEALRSLDIVVHASTQPEPFGLVVAEAMGCGRALIISEAGGAAELVTDGEDALGHTPGDARALAERIFRLITDKDLRPKLERQSRVTAELRFDRARYVEEIVSIYESQVA